MIAWFKRMLEASKDQDKFWRDYHRYRRTGRLKELLDERATYQGRVEACSRLIAYYESKLCDGDKQ